MSTIANPFFLRADSDICSKDCSESQDMNLTQEEPDKSQIDNSRLLRMGCYDLTSQTNTNTTTTSSNSINSPNASGGSSPAPSAGGGGGNYSNENNSRKNKRKNFLPRNITEFADSEEDQNQNQNQNQNHHGTGHLPTVPLHRPHQGDGPIYKNPGIGAEISENLRNSSRNMESSDDEAGSLDIDEGDEEMDFDEETNRINDSGSDDDENGAGQWPLDLSEMQNDYKRFWEGKEPLNLNAGNHQNLNSLLGENAGLLLRARAVAAAAAFQQQLEMGGGGAIDLSNRLGLPNPNLNVNQTANLDDRQSSNSSSPQAPNLLADFAENTMKELLALYGVDSYRQGGVKNSELARNLEAAAAAGQHSKMKLPENMARLLAAMQDAGQFSHGQNVNPINFSKMPPNNPNLNNIPSQPGKNHISSILATSNNSSDSMGSGHHGLGQKSGKIPHHHRPSGKPMGSGGRGLGSFPVIREGLLGKGSGPVDYTRYVRRFANSIDCGFGQCRDLNYREHFHCLDCSDGTRIFVKKEEMIRHFKWHKKRDESLQHGFMRYSPMDDCTDRFKSNCSHNRKQTHYHCMQNGCDKVYISTSDVQMHSNYHRKDSAIIQEGFQRFRAAEDCGADHCSFRFQKTTHFHCRRETCSYTFKNKADMEKHKSYHIKDEQLNRDGFKKFMKHESCNYSNCRFSKVCNHIHCISDGCNYVLHSSGQLYSHKRKHERRESELAYRKYKLAQSVLRGKFSGLGLPELPPPMGLDDENSDHSIPDPYSADMDLEEIMKKFLSPCDKSQCQMDKNEDHFQCKVDNCPQGHLGSTEEAVEHAKSHELEERISSLAYFAVDPANFDAQDSTIPCVSAKCPYQTREKHFHCLWDGCSEIILSSDEAFKRLEHFRAHESSQKLEFGGILGGNGGISNDGHDSPIEENDSDPTGDGFFGRKRGRPPKNRHIEVSSGGNEAIFTSFKLPKPNLENPADHYDSDVKDPVGFLSFPEGTDCPDQSCSFSNASHFHCGHPRCHFAVADVHKLSLHLRDFHSTIDILEGFEYFDKNSECYEGPSRNKMKKEPCGFGGKIEHFHCTRDGFGFLKPSMMGQHEAENHDSKSLNSSLNESIEKSIKSSGTFYPISTIKSGIPKMSINNNTILTNNNPMDLSNPSPNGLHQEEQKQITDHSLSRILQLPTQLNQESNSGETLFGPKMACGRPFCKLKRKPHFHCHLCNQAFSELDKLRPHVLKHSNFSPNKSISSQNLSNNGGGEHSDGGSSDEELHQKMDSDDPQSDTGSKHNNDKSGEMNNNHSSKSSHIKQQNQLNFPPDFPSSPSTSVGFPANFLYPNSPVGAAAAPYLFLGQNPLTSLYANMMFGGGLNFQGSQGHPGLPMSPDQMSLNLPNDLSMSSNSNSTPPPSLNVNKLKRPPSRTSTGSPGSPPDSKKSRPQARIMKDEPVPQGYLRFRFNEDCNYVHCGYREHQTHFHCMREDCGYSFCDKTRFVQHTARHERLDTLMGGDFKQFRANVYCGHPDCNYIPTAASISGQQNKASHFHCMKCDFVCSDTNKVVAHRRQHQKLESIMAAGFEKFTPSQHCQVDGCIHAQKQTHYHCTNALCKYAVLGLSQMSAHKYRHVEG